MKEINLDNLNSYERERYEEYKSELGNRIKTYVATFAKVTGAFALAGILANGAVFASGTHRVPFTRGMVEGQLHTKTIYTSNEAPETMIVTSSNSSLPDQLTYIGEARVISEDNPDMMIRELVEPINIPESFHEEFDKDELYSEIIHDPVIMAEVLDLLNANRTVQMINAENTDDLEPSRFTITSFDSTESTMVVRDTWGNGNDKFPIELLEWMSVAIYVCVLVAVKWEIVSNHSYDRRNYKKLKAKVRKRKQEEN